MPIPESVQKAVQTAKNQIENHPSHLFSPIQRKAVWEAFHAQGEIGTRAWAWLAIITAKKVLPFYVEPDYDVYNDESFKNLPEEEQLLIQEQDRYINPHEAIALAEKVMKGEFDRAEAWRIASDTHYMIGHFRGFQPVQAAYVEKVGNKVLVEVSGEAWKPFQFLNRYSRKGSYFSFGGNNTSGESFSDLDWSDSGGGDTAASAYVAWSAVVSPPQSIREVKDYVEAKWWMDNPQFDTEKALSFWNWWLTDAMDEAWEKAQEA